MQDRNEFPHLSRPLSDQEQLDIKRLNGQLPCAECKRAKRKCDKKLPCTPCAQKGCGSICPTGTLSSWAGKNLILSGTAALHQKINAMASRIYQLEDALAVLQRMISPHETHPLLREELLTIKSHLNINTAQDDNATEAEELAKALGTLSINEDGHVKYFGPSAGSETLLSVTMKQRPSAPITRDPLFLNLSISSPTEVINNPILRSEDPIMVLVSSLPPKLRAWSLIEAFFEHSWLNSTIVTRQDIVDEYITPTYTMKAAIENGMSVVSKDTVSLHKLALVYILFGLGALVDLTLPPFSDEAEQYYDLATVALSSRSLFLSPELATIQALSLCAMYHMQGSGRHNNMDGVWMFVSVASKLAQSIGLHRESSRWNLNAALTERRRKAFWGLFTLDTYLSLSVGRPPSFQLGYVDCEFPVDDEETIDVNGVHRTGPIRWIYYLNKNVLSTVIAATLLTKKPSYSVILELDRKIRECSLPAVLDTTKSSNDPDTPLTFMTQNGMAYVRATTILFLHKRFFAQAMLEHPSDPLRSPYAPSFLACYRCACDIIQLNARNFTKFPFLIIRWRAFWNSLFSVAVIVGTICTRVQNVTMARQAFAELSIAVDIFEYGAPVVLRAKCGLVILRKLMNKATAVLNDINTVESAHDPSFGMYELETYGGYTKVVQRTEEPEVVALYPDNDGAWNSGDILYPGTTSDTIAPSLLTKSLPDIGKSIDQYVIPEYAQYTSPANFDRPLADPSEPTLSFFVHDNDNNGVVRPSPIENAAYVEPASFNLPPTESMGYFPTDLLPDGYPMDFTMPGPGKDAIFNAQWATFMQSVFNENNEGETESGKS